MLKIGKNSQRMEKRLKKARESVFFESSGRVFTLKGDILKKITDYNLTEPSSADAKTTTSILEGMKFDSYAIINK